jgi:hypothetical protein
VISKLDLDFDAQETAGRDIESSSTNLVWGTPELLSHEGTINSKQTKNLVSPSTSIT